MEYMDRVVVKRSIKTQLIYLIISLFVGSIFGLIFYLDLSSVRYINILINVFAGAFVLFFGLLVLHILRSFTKPLLVIDAVGFLNNGAKYGMIPWSNVRYVYNAKSKSNRSKSSKYIGDCDIGIELLSYDDFMNSLSKSKRKSESLFLSVLIPVIIIDATFAKRDIKDIVDIMRKYLAEYQRSNEGYSGYESKNKVVEKFDKIVLERRGGRIMMGFCLVMVAIFSIIMSVVIMEGMIEVGIMLLPFVIIFGSLAIRVFIKTKNKTPVMVIDRDGFTDYENNAGLILWRDLESMEVVSRTRTSKDSDGRTTVTVTTTIDVKVKGIDKLIMLTLFGSNETHEDVADVMRRYQSEYIKNNSSSEY